MKILTHPTNTNIVNRPKTPEKNLQNKMNKNYTFWGNCWRCGEFGQLAKECQNNLTMANQDQTHYGPTSIQTIELIRYPTQISPARLPVLTQQITAGFQLSQEDGNKVSSQMSEMTKANKLWKKAVKSTYKKLPSIQIQYPKKASNHLQTSKKYGTISITSKTPYIYEGSKQKLLEAG